jgi:hypothetical protein
MTGPIVHLPDGAPAQKYEVRLKLGSLLTRPLASATTVDTSDASSRSSRCGDGAERVGAVLDEASQAIGIAVATILVILSDVVVHVKQALVSLVAG